MAKARARCASLFAALSASYLQLVGQVQASLLGGDRAKGQGQQGEDEDGTHGV